MSLKTICRLCLTINSPMYTLVGSPLQVIYEKLTSIPLKTPQRPMVACLLCCSQLRKCHNLIVRSARAEEVLSQLLQNKVVSEETVAMINSNAYQLSLTPIELVSITGSMNNLMELTTKEQQMNEPTNVKDLKYERSEEKELFNGTGLANEEDSNISIGRQNVKNEELKEEVDNVNEEWTHEQDIKTALLEDVNEYIHGVYSKCPEIVGTETIKIEDMMLNLMEGAGDIESIDSEGAIVTTNWKQIRMETQDSMIEQKIQVNQKKRRAAEDNESPNITCTYPSMDNYAAMTLQESKNTSRYFDVAINRGDVVIDIDDCTGIIDDYNCSSIHLNKVFICNDCGDIFDNKYLLVDHIEHHKAVKRNKTEKSDVGSVIGCSKLQRQRLNETVVNKHTETHTGMYGLEYDICEQGFIQRNYDFYHSKTHTGDKPFKCPICQREFTQKGNMKTHLKTHTGEKPFGCTECQRRFIQKSHLVYHLRSHIGEKPFQCPVCERSFTQTGNLQTHLKTHSGETQFQCTICQRSFTQKGNMQKHLETHGRKSVS